MVTQVTTSCVRTAAKDYGFECSSMFVCVVTQHNQSLTRHPFFNNRKENKNNNLIVD